MNGRKTIVVTGGKGLIGSYLLSDRSVYNWISVVRPSTEYCENEIGVDLAARWEPASAGLPERCDGVIYLAQSNAYRHLPERAADLFQCNVVSLAKMLEYGKRGGAESFVYASTGSVYKEGEGLISEKTSTISSGGNSLLYPWSKLTGESLVESYSDHFSTAILRLFFVYGSRGNQQMLLPIIAQRVREGFPISLQAPEGVVLCPTHARDAADVFISCLSLSGTNLINVAGPESLSLKEIATMMGDRMGKAPFFKEDAGNAAAFHVDTTRMREALGRELTCFSEGLCSLLE